MSLTARAPTMIAPMRVAVVHEWLVNRGGSEAVVEALLGLFPDADLYVLVADPELTRMEPWCGHRIFSSFLQRLPLSPRRFRWYLPWFPMAVELHNLRGYDLVISSHHAVSHGVLTDPGQRHICYVHSPMRYAWDQQPEYLASVPLPLRVAVAASLHRLRIWDAIAAQRPDVLVANSKFVARRIRQYWGAESQVVHPPVAMAPESSARAGHEDYFLWLGRLVPYKRVDLAISTFNALKLKLIIAGDGPELPRLRAMAGPTISFLGAVGDERKHALMNGAAALIFPGIEDFGIVPVEAIAHGLPVIALARGGALESVEDGITGILFAEPTVPSMIEAVRRFQAEGVQGSPETFVASAARFSAEQFSKNFSALVADVMGSPQTR